MGSKLNSLAKKRMPVEVIDLLSSPEVAPPPAKTISTAAAAPTASRPRLPARALNYDDILDLTDSTDHGLLPAPRTRPAPAAAASRPQRPSPKPSRADDFSFSSDLFDTTTFDLFNARLDAPPSKKPRISESLPDTVEEGGTSRPFEISASGLERSGSVVVGWGAPGVLQLAAPKKWNSSADPIQTSSDPFATPARAKVNKAKENFIDLSLDDDDDDDLFASSPRSVQGKGKERVSASPKQARNQMPSSPLFMSSQPQGKDMDSPPPRNKTPKGKGKGKEPLAWDHISSSAPSAGFRDDDGDMDVQPVRKGLSRSRSDGVDFDLGDLAAYEFASDDDDDTFPDIGAIQPSKSGSSRSQRNNSGITKRPTTSKPSASKKSAAGKELERLDKAAAREAEKRRKQLEKEEAKEQRQREKERAAALAEVNKVRTDKKVSTPEMIVDLPTSLHPGVALQIETLLEDLNVKCHRYSSPVQNVVKWRRKVKARFNEDEGHWEPIRERVEDERHAMVIITAPEFVELALGTNGSDLEAHVLRMQRYYEDHVLIYLLQGLTPWMRNNRNNRNKQFQSAVRNAGANVDVDVNAVPPPSAQSRKKKDPKPPPQYVDEDALEDALLQLQVQHGALIHHTAAAVETAQWVAIFTQHISTIPYRRQKDAVNSNAAFCMDSGQVRTGDGPQDTYVRMLQEISRITTPIAYGITGKFGSVSELVRGLETEGPLVLENIRKSANRDGAYTDRTVGQAISRRMWKVFTGTDETSTGI